LGKILFIENYDMEIASKMVQGVDIWLNTPTRPLEASGTSGQKAIMNGVVNFSVLDGWFAEGYKENAGWALKEETTFENHQFQDELDAETIYDILEDEIIPTFYKRDKDGISAKWISYVKNTIAEVAPQFTTKRMIDDYIKLFYTKLINRSKELTENKFELVKKLSFWKKKIIREWENIEVVSMNIPDYSNHAYKLGEKFVAEIRLNLHDLKPEEIGIEIIFGEKEFDQIKNIFHKSEMVPVTSENNVVIYRTQIFVTRPGVFNYAFRMFPKNSMLPHLQDFNLIRWL
ncbi:MAG TPA: alpha-glucan family phosphorylase, partial [Bacteroidales bacterium]|nr:alpha-glucan family phosphorylase [Bacteroidales bacterium]